MKLAYYPGCSGQGTSAAYERSTRAVCRALEIGLKEISDWSCCGSTPAHACDHVLSSALSARNLALAAAEGAERVGTPCPSCLANLKTAKYRMQDEAFRDKVNALLDNPCPEELPETVSILQVLVEDVYKRQKQGAAINLLFLHDYSPYSMKKRNSPAEEANFTMLTRSLSRRRDALPQKSSPLSLIHILEVRTPVLESPTGTSMAVMGSGSASVTNSSAATMRMPRVI